MNKKIFIYCLCVFALAVSTFLLLKGCNYKPKYTESKLPLPPGADSGLYEGKFIQTDYGFGIPLPPKWLYLRLSAEQEVDEVARFTDPNQEMIVRVTVQLTSDTQSFTQKGWLDSTDQDLKNHQFKIQKKGSAREWKTEGGEPWDAVTYRLTDPRDDSWADQEWVLHKGDLLIGAHVLMPQEDADSAAGEKFFKALEGSLTQIHWYRPIGSRGISIERYELQHFTENVCRALESHSCSKIEAYFDELYPDRLKFCSWYQQVVAGNSNTYELKAELSGLVINGDYATAVFTLTRKNKGEERPQKFERDFKLSKKEGTWKIMTSLDKN